MTNSIGLAQASSAHAFAIPLAQRPERRPPHQRDPDGVAQERAQRELIRRLADAGDDAAALATYEKLRERLRRELSLAPGVATRDLVAAIRAASVERTRSSACRFSLDAIIVSTPSSV